MVMVDMEAMDMEVMAVDITVMVGMGMVFLAVMAVDMVVTGVMVLAMQVIDMVDMVMEATVITDMVLVINNNPMDMVRDISNNLMDMVRIINSHHTISQSLMPNLKLTLSHKPIVKHIIMETHILSLKRIIKDKRILSRNRTTILKPTLNNQLRNTAIHLTLKVVIAMAAIHNSILKQTLCIKRLQHRTDYNYLNIIKMYLSCF